MTRARPYHHGDLRRAVLTAAAEAIAESGPSALSLRELARRAEVSHAAPAHHFRDKAGVLTALATEGFELLADALEAAAEHRQLLELGVAYVRFALDHPAHFDVMYRPELYHADDPGLQAAERRTDRALLHGVEQLPDDSIGEDHRLAGIAAWSLMHGFSTLWLNGALAGTVGDDPEAAARSIGRLLFRAPSAQDQT